MLFTSMSFIYLFLPVLILLQFITNKKYHNIILLIASIIFYAFGGINYLFILFGIILINYLGALAINKYENFKKIILFITVILNLSSLIYFKYFNFIVENINNFCGLNINITKIILPIGISFYTFQAMSYLFDVYRKNVEPEKNLLNISLFICLFPQLIAGPIIKYHDISHQIESRELNTEKISLGIKRFIIGFSKKMLIANVLGVVADKIFNQNPFMLSSLETWIGAVCYSFQLFYDFSGYSDMAIGLGLIFGFKFMENFNYPYISKSMTEFWHRWHISLSTWFKEYLYIPLGGNRNGKFKTIKNLFIVFFFTGLWHGANWTFIIWGIWNGLFIIFEKIINIKNLEIKYNNWFFKLLQHFYCIIVFLIGWVIFRSNDINYAINYITNMFGLILTDKTQYKYSIYYYFSLKEYIILIIAILCSAPLFKNIINIKNNILNTFINIWLLILFLLSTISLAATTYNPFIYFRF